MNQNPVLSLLDIIIPIKQVRGKNSNNHIMWKCIAKNIGEAINRSIDDAIMAIRNVCHMLIRPCFINYSFYNKYHNECTL